MTDIKNEIKFDGGKVCVFQNGIISFTTSVDKLEIEHAENFINTLGSLNLTKDVLVLFDGKSLKETTSGAVKKYTASKLEDHSKALAVINNSPISRFLIHTFIAIYRPDIPIKMFDNEERAKKWLLEFKGQNA